MQVFADWRDIANLAYWVTGTEGSNPSLSAKIKGFSAFRHIVNQTRQQPTRSNLDQNFWRALSDHRPRRTFQTRHLFHAKIVRLHSYGRRTVIKASYHRNFKAGGKWSGALERGARYMERGHDKEPGHKELGWNETEDRVHIMATAHNWSLAHDRLHWRIILSPDDADLIDVREHVRKVMGQMEKDLGTKLKWVGVEHDNTDHRHAHILIRGVRQEIDRNGKCVTLTMPREYVSQGIRIISQQLIERELGPRTEREYLQARGNGIEGECWTEIDRAIERRFADSVADYSFARYLNERARPGSAGNGAPRLSPWARDGAQPRR